MAHSGDQMARDAVRRRTRAARRLVAGLFGVVLASAVAARGVHHGSMALHRESDAAQQPHGDGGAMLQLGAGKGVMVRLSKPALAVFVADPAIADVRVPDPNDAFVLAKKPGTTTLYALGAHHETILQQTVVVGQDVDTLQQVLQTRFPHLTLQLSSAPGSLTVSGKVDDPRQADEIVQTLTPYLQSKEQLINRMTIEQPLQVQLRVRIAEVDRNVTQQLGINWQSLSNAGIGDGSGVVTGGIFGTRQIFTNTTPQQIILPTTGAYTLFGNFTNSHNNISALVDALSQEGLLTMLAEPNLVAKSGETASFLAGGEFPIPVQEQNNAISIVFKQFGVKLDFTPTVLSRDHISLRVRPEVSQLDSSASVVTNGITVPGLSVRRVDTTVDLASGQSFAIGGLLQATSNDTLSKIPGAGDLPVLGKLFQSKNYQNNRSELVVIVTPYLVHPTDPSKLTTPIDTVMRPSSDVEYGMSPQAGESASPDSAPRLVGAAGFIY